MPRRCARKGCNNIGTRRRVHVLSAKNVGKALTGQFVIIWVCKKHDPQKND